MANEEELSPVTPGVVLTTMLDPPWVPPVTGTVPLLPSTSPLLSSVDAVVTGVACMLEAFGNEETVVVVSCAVAIFCVTGFAGADCTACC